jgi:methionyl aminopeptidase
LLRVTEQALALAISLATVGRHLHDIGAAVQLYVEREGCNVVRGLVGHGIGRSMWEDPQVPNYAQDTCGPALKAGMVFTIEPMVNAGTADTVMLSDQWTIVTADHKLSAHFEHTIAVTPSGPRILTTPSNAAATWGLTPPTLDLGMGRKRAI